MGTALSLATRGSALWTTILIGACAPSVEVTSRPSAPHEREAMDSETGPRAWPAPAGSMGLIPPVVLRLDSGLRIVAPAETGKLLSAPTAQVALTIPFGAMDGPPGVADLIADAVAANSEGEPDRPALQATLSGLGATLSIQIGAHSTTFAIEVPGARWQDALTALSAAVSDFPQTQEQFERIRERTLARLTNESQVNPVDFTIEQLLAGDVEGPAARLAGIRERDLAEARALHRLHYRPTGAVVGVVVPGLPGDRALATTKSITIAWTGELRAEEPHSAPLQTGVYWSPGDPPSRVAIVVTQPDPWDPHAAAIRLLQECTTMSGLGGRLERALDQAGDTGFLFTNRTLAREGRRHLILEATLPPDQVFALWQILQDVRASYLDVPPSEAELRPAADRASLILMGDQANPRHWLETAMWQILRQRKPEPPVDFLVALESPGGVDLRAAVAELQDWPLALVVVGGRPGPHGDLPLVLLPETRSPTMTRPPDASAEIAAAEPHLRKAIDAAGGPEHLRAVTGYSAVSDTTPETGPGLSDRIWVAADRLRRERRVLATTVETVVTAEGGYESSEGERRELSEPERHRILQEAHSHPLSLLAGGARGEIEFRYVSRRQVGDREMVVLEAVDPALGQLRMHVELGSGLVRVVESWRAGSGSGPSYARETYSDYRSVGGIRVPFHRLTERDSGARRFETRWLEFQPGRPPDSLLGRQR